MKARRRIGPQADTVPDFAEARLEPPPQKGCSSTRPTNATPRGQPRDSSGAGLARFEVVLADRTRLHRSEGSWLPAPRESWRGGLLFSTTGSSASRNHRLWRDDGERRLGASSAERLVLLRTARDRGVRSRFTPLPTADNAAGSGCAARKGPRSRALTGSGRACSPGDQGHAWAGRSPGCVVKRSLDRRESEIERSAGCSCTWVSCRR